MVNMSSETSSECWASILLFCGFNFASTVNIYCLKNRFYPSVCQISSSFKEDQLSQPASVFEGQKDADASLVSRENVWIRFYNCPHWFWIHYKIPSHFFHEVFGVPPYLLSNSFDVAFCTTWVRASAFGTLLGVDIGGLFEPHHRIIKCGFRYF